MIKIKHHEQFPSAPGRLQCPDCGGDKLRQLQTNVYTRDESGRDPTAFMVDGASGELLLTKDDGAQKQNPSPHEQGLTIMFTCENCFEADGATGATVSKKFALNIWNHKGATFIDWGK